MDTKHVYPIFTPTETREKKVKGARVVERKCGNRCQLDVYYVAEAKKKAHKKRLREKIGENA